MEISKQLLYITTFCRSTSTYKELRQEPEYVYVFLIELTIQYGYQQP